MPYRPQYAVEPTPPGFQDEEFAYNFVLPSLSAGQSINKQTLQFQQDAEFICRGIQLSGNTGPLQIRFYDPFGNELAAAVLEADLQLSGTLQSGAPIGRLPVVFEPEIRVPAGGFLQVDLEVL